MKNQKFEERPIKMREAWAKMPTVPKRNAWLTLVLWVPIGLISIIAMAIKGVSVQMMGNVSMAVYCISTIFVYLNISHLLIRRSEDRDQLFEEISAGLSKEDEIALLRSRIDVLERGEQEVGQKDQAAQEPTEDVVASVRQSAQ